MFGIFTKNLDTMERATKNKKSVRNLDDVNKIHKQEMDQIFGGNVKSEKKKNRFFGWFSPCEGELPQ
jgi:hypothetical protein